MAEVNLIQGDCLEVLKGLESESYCAALCDPPYGISFMGKEWDHGVPSKDVWAEVLRVLKPGGVLLAFGGSRTHHRLFMAIEDAGFELCDSLAWIYGQGWPKGLNISKAIDKAAGAERKVVGPNRYASRRIEGSGPSYNDLYYGDYGIPGDETAPATDAAKAWQGYGTSLKPAIEFICLARKSREGTYAQDAMQYGTGALWIEGTRVGAAGRWPSNLILSHSEACEEWHCVEGCPVAELNRQSGVSKSTGPSNHSRTIGDGNIYHGGKGMRTAGHYDRGGASRFFYCAKAGRREKEVGLEELPLKEESDWRNTHTTIKPLSITEYLARLIVPPSEYRDDAQLLIPFAGVMSEGIGAVLAGWRNITAIELQEEYCEIGRLRIDWWTAKMEATGLTDPRAILQACGIKEKRKPVTPVSGSSVMKQSSLDL